jgi:type IV pilus assembly protein PilX
MIFLVILSILGVSAMQSSTLSSRIASNEADRNLAFQAAEAALLDGELDVRNQRFDRSRCIPAIAGCRARLTQGRVGFDISCPEGRCAFVDGAAIWETASRWTAGNSVLYGTYTGAGAFPLVSNQPRYILEAIPFDEPTYRITAVGYGAKSSSQVMLQTVIVVKNQL